MWNISHTCCKGVAQTGVGSSPFTGGNWGRRGRGTPQALLRNVLGEPHWVSESPVSPTSPTPPRGHHPQGREEEEECGQRCSSRMKSRGDGFQLSDVQGSLKALAGGVPGGWHLVTATGTQGGACLPGGEGSAPPHRVLAAHHPTAPWSRAGLSLGWEGADDPSC